LAIRCKPPVADVIFEKRDRGRVGLPRSGLYVRCRADVDHGAGLPAHLFALAGKSMDRYVQLLPVNPFIACLKTL
jgi:hypothetical protein